MKARIGLNQRAKEISGQALEGESISLSDYKGKVVLIDILDLRIGIDNTGLTRLGTKTEKLCAVCSIHTPSANSPPSKSIKINRSSVAQHLCAGWGKSAIYLD